MDFYHILVHLHSIVRWLLLIFLAYTIIRAWRKSTEASGKSKSLKPALITMELAHLQLIIGLVLYFISPKVVFAGSSMSNPVFRFFLVEHILVMLIGIALITIGYLKAKKATPVDKQNKTLLLYFIIALFLIVSRIPWPFLSYGGGWM